MTDMRQVAPFPDALADVVDGLTVYPHWHARLSDSNRGQGCEGLTFSILVECEDAYHPGVIRHIQHLWPVPAAAYDRRAWRRWVLDRCLDVVTHETCEHFRDGDERPYAPNHGPGRDPYVVHELGTWEDADTSFKGERNS